MFGVEIVYLGYIYYEERKSKTIYFGGGELNAKWGELIAFDTISDISIHVENADVLNT